VHFIIVHLSILIILDVCAIYPIFSCLNVTERFLINSVKCLKFLALAAFLLLFFHASLCRYSYNLFTVLDV